MLLTTLEKKSADRLTPLSECGSKPAVSDPSITIVVPVLNEADNIAALVEELVQVAKGTPILEIIYVDDGSADSTLTVLSALKHDVPILRVVRHNRRFGQSAAFLSGARAAKGQLLVFIDGDLQNDPSDIPALFERYKESSRAGMRVAVLGQRTARRDNLLRRVSSTLANRLRSIVLNDGTRDTGCSLKLMHRDDFLALPYFDHLHRFLPAMLLRNGIELHYVPVKHRARVAGQSKYGFWNRALVGAVDLAGAVWLLRRRLPNDYSPIEISDPEKSR